MEKRKSDSSCRDAPAALAPASVETLCGVEVFGHPSDNVASLHGSSGDRCSTSSEGSFGVCDGENDSSDTPEWASSSTSSRSNSIISDIEAQPRRPVSDEELPDRRKPGTEKNDERKMEEEEVQEEQEEDGDVLVRNKPAKENGSSAALKRSRRKRRGEDKRRKGRPEEGSTRLDDAWSNRWLTGGKS